MLVPASWCRVAALTALAPRAVAYASAAAPYPVGVPGTPWAATERAQWLSRQMVQRSYRDEVVAKVEMLRDRFVVERYGALSHDEARYPLFAIRTREWSDSKPSVLVTGGVHGYETSGVQGAILFLQSAALVYASRFNIVVAPCVSPWAYETIQRWNAQV